MTAETQDPGGTGARSGLTIGELARRTGVNVATLRMWESRHGFPQAHRLPSGHRRYDPGTVDLVRQVQRRRAAGARLEAAVAEIRDPEPPPSTSVYAELRKQQPQLTPYRLRKPTMVALSRALEDECCTRGQGGWLFGSFQHEAFYRRSEARWRDLARTTRRAWVLGQFDEPRDDGGPVEVPLPPDGSMVREWAVLCFSQELCLALSAWELPGQAGKPDHERLFESVWTLDPQAVRHATRAFAHLVSELGHDTTDVVADLGRPVRPALEDVAQATSLFNRVVAYVDRQSS